MTPTAHFDADAVILGAGAAGLLAAIAAGERGKRVVVLEKAPKPGVKILMSGGSRCNITHDCDSRGIVEAFAGNGKFLHGPLSHFGTRDAVRLFEAEGVRTKAEATGKIFPESDRALDVLNALLSRLHRTGAKILTHSPAKQLDAIPEGEGGGFRVGTEVGTLTARSVLVATGGLSYPRCGTTGDGYGFAAKFGHTIVRTRPALVPLTCELPWVRALSGLTLPDITLRVLEPGQKPLSLRRGSLLFTHSGLSGPAAMDVSRAVSGHAEPARLRVELDLVPDLTEPQLAALIAAAVETQPKKLLAGLLSDWVPKRIAEQLLVELGQPADRRAAGLSKADQRTLVGLHKRLALPITGTLGYEKAEVTAGGVALDEVDSRTMQSKRHPGLYLAGEVLDLDGWIGGYNFQSAWSTGHLAGSKV